MSRAVQPALGTVNRGATRVIESARAAILGDLGEGAPVLKTTIRQVEAAAQEARDRGLLVHELEEAVLAGPKLALGTEIIARITQGEATPPGRHQVATAGEGLR